MSTSGTVGAQWNGSQYAHTDSPSTGSTGGCDVLHTYTRLGSGATTLTFDVGSSVSVSGTAAQYISGTDWWWNSQNTADDDPVTVLLYDPGTGYYAGTIDWATNDQSDAQGGDAGSADSPPYSSNNNGNQSSSTMYAGSDTTGRAVGTCNQLPDVVGAKATAQYSCGATASACVDNASVTYDKLALAFTFSTLVEEE